MIYKGIGMKPAFTYWPIDATNPIFVRIDGNVPHDNGTIQDDFRLQRVIPTINALYQRGCPVIVATHLGRPGGTFDAAQTTNIIAEWFRNQGYQAAHVPHDGQSSITEYMNQVQAQPHHITVIDNLRFFPGEKEHDQAYIDALSQSAQWYINDAWGMMHRTDSSVYNLAQQYDNHHRSFGYIVEQEIASLEQLRNNPKRPYTVILGGAKAKSKILLIKQLVEHGIPDTIIITPGMAGTFLKAAGYDIGQSLCEDELVETAQSIMDTANKHNITVDIPTDLYIVRGSWKQELETVDVDAIPDNGIAIASGPKTLDRYKQYIHKSETIFLNGPMGDIQYFHTIRPFTDMLSMIASSNAYRVVGGGDSVAMIQTLAHDPFDFYSTGGGATLAYISQQELPALQILQ